MNEVTQILSDLAQGDAQAAGQLLPLVYEELRKLAAARMAAEAPGNTLNATALVHEAYLRLVGPADAARWDNRGHFFAAAAEAMRRILVEAARRKRPPEARRRSRRIELAPRPGRGSRESRRRTARPGRSPDPARRRGPGQGRSGQTALLRRADHRRCRRGAGPVPSARRSRHWTYARAWLQASRAGPRRIPKIREQVSAGFSH